MAVPVLKLNLAPPTNFWRLNHAGIGWALLAAGSLTLLGSLGFTWRAYQAAAKAGREAASTSASTNAMADTQRRVLAELRDIDVAKELPRWRLAERIFTERSLPWSRLTAELERNLAQDVRLKSVQRTRGSDLRVQLKLKGEAKSRAAESAFVEALQKNPFFEQVVLEREGERQGGGVDFDCTLAAVSLPPPYVPLPKYGPATKVAAVAKPMAQPGRGKGTEVPVRPAPVPSSRPTPMGGAPAMGMPGPGGPGQMPQQLNPMGSPFQPREPGVPAQARPPQGRRNPARQRSQEEMP